MLHRFRDPQMGNVGDDPDLIRQGLAYLRRHRYDLISLTEMFERASRNVPLKGAVAFTIDDGYRDHASVAGPLFAEFDCPVTTFVTTGFIDGQIWFWWDKIEYAFGATRKDKLRVRVGSTDISLRWQNTMEREAAQRDFTTACKEVTDQEKQLAIERLAMEVEVELPAAPPAVYAPLSWSDAKRCEQAGMTFGPHTVTHPILSRATDEQSRAEIEGSWQRLCSQVSKPVPVFCYPNGQGDDFGAREIEHLVRLGLLGAVVGMPGYATGAAVRDSSSRFKVRRFPMPVNTADLLQCVTGLEGVKDRIRGARN